MNFRTCGRSGLLIATVFSTFAVADMHEAQGQLFRRFRQRVQSAAPPQYRPQTPNIAVPNGATTGARYRIDPRTGRAVLVQPSTGSTPGLGRANQVQPKPASPTSSAAKPDTKNPRQTNPARTNSGNTPANQSDDSKPGQFGNSILRANAAGRTSGKDQAKGLPGGQVGGATLGLRVAAATAGTAGLDILAINDNSMADEAGIRVGDRILLFNGQRTTDVPALGQLLSQSLPGSIATIRIGRGRQMGDFRVLLGKRAPAVDSEPKSSQVASSKPSVPPKPSDKAAAPAQSNGVQLGVQIEDVPGTRGVVILSVDPDSPADNAGLVSGDRIVSIDGRMVVNTDALARELSVRSREQSMALQLVRQNQLRASTVSFQTSAKDADKTGPDSQMSGENGAADDASASRADSKSEQPSAGSVMGGVGSMLGGLFGGRPSTDDKSVSDTPSTLPKSNVGSPDLNAEVDKSILDKSKPSIDQGAQLRARSLDPPIKQESASGSIQQVGAIESAVTPAVSNAVTGTGADEMAFGDDEPINQAIFASPIEVIEIPERKLDSNKDGAAMLPIAKPDPPSAAKMQPPVKTAEMQLTPPLPANATTKQKIADLEAEVNRLKQLLKQTPST